MADCPDKGASMKLQKPSCRLAPKLAENRAESCADTVTVDRYKRRSGEGEE